MDDKRRQKRLNDSIDRIENNGCEKIKIIQSLKNK
jgi:hypothetical protein